ncbi:low molecular weight phosphotyrosine protein phosphatase [Acrasis kona]|uniref:Low molecular weight phosphotyrosine protein phosphatase n=1 Tax=Acrasis kona TaxID=1008807 RepID=A0AAW2YSF0_9EUKA
MMGHERVSVLFVCLGNICRSPMAEITFTELLRQKGISHEWKVDSAGTAGYHTGDAPDSRSVSTCKKFLGNDINVKFKARQVKKTDFNEFQYILCMDESNLDDLLEIRPKNSTAVVKLLGQFDPEGDTIIKDPYYGGLNGFEHNFNQVKRSLEAFISYVQSK